MYIVRDLIKKIFFSSITDNDYISSFNNHEILYLKFSKILWIFILSGDGITHILHRLLYALYLF